MRLHDYQETARDFLRGRPSAGLFLDMGLGKTATTLMALRSEDLPALVVAPKRVAEHVWPAERELWRPDLSLALAAGTPQQRRAALDARADLTVISRDNLADAPPSYATLILDELSSFKTPGSARFKTARRLRKTAHQVWGLTGTPAPNGYLDLWSQVYLLDKGERLGTSLTGYRNRYFWATGQLPSGIPIGWELREGAEERIKAKIQDICLYMEASDYLPLDKPTQNVVEVELPANVKRMYRELSADLVLDLDMLGTFSAANAAVLTSKLSQLTSGFLFSDEQDGSFTELHSAKLDALREVRDGTGDNLLVFYNFIPERERIRKAFPEARTIDEPGVYSAWNRGEVPMLLCHPASAGHGLNLQHGGHTIVWASLTWDLELFQQANGRLARQGQQHPVIIHKLVAAGTVDVTIGHRLDDKTFEQAGLLDHLRSPL